MQSFLRALIWAAACVSPVAMAQVIDQSDTSDNTRMAWFRQGDLAQSFQQSMGNITGAGIYLEPGQGTSDTVTISLWDNLPTEGGHMLATGSTTGVAGEWADVSWNSVNIAQNNTYYLVFSGNNTLCITGDTWNQYDRGQAFATSGFRGFETYDYTFRTYAMAPAVPEPSESALLLGGLFAIGAVLRRRRK